MASTPQNSKQMFPKADVVGELNPGMNTHFHVDSASSEVAASKEQAEVEEKRKERERKETMETLKSGIIISSIIVAVAGAAIAITKKLREK